MRHFPLLFSPLKIGKRVIKNRIVSSAHGEGFAQDGLMNERLVNYYEHKAAGGTGLIIAFGSGNVYEKATHPKYVSLWNPKNEFHFRELADRVHYHGSLILAQATHKGRRLNSRVTGHPLQAPSAIPEGISREIPGVLRTDEIKEIIKSYASVAKKMEAFGFDGIEVTSYGGHLIEQFWSPALNKRTDQYGGDLTGRMRFSVEVLEAISDSVSDQFIISFRMTGDPLTDMLGLDSDDMLEIASRLDSLGRINLFDISGSSGVTPILSAGTVPPDPLVPGLYKHLSRKMKEHLSVPVLVAGKIMNPDQAESALLNGDCDAVAMTRAIIADPDMPRKAMDGKVLQIRPCIGTNQGCIGRTSDGLPMACAVNAAIGNDSLYNYAPIESRHKIVIVGGGPAGMEAARVTAERGHNIVLFESSKELGGQILFGKSQPNRKHFGEHIKWLRRELERLQIDIQLETKATIEIILANNPDSVIISTGAMNIVPKEAEGVMIPCVTDVDVLNGKQIIDKGSRIFIYDGGSNRGGYIANYAANLGASKIELATSLPTVCEDLDSTNKPFMYQGLAKNNVICTPHQELIGQREGNLILVNKWSNQERIVTDVDLIIFAGYRVSLNNLEEPLLKKKPDLNIHIIGDCLAPRTMLDAVTEGVRIGNEIGCSNKNMSFI